MKNLTTTVLAASLGLLCSAALYAQGETKQPGAEGKMPKQAAGPRARVSPHETTGAVIDGDRVTIIYGRPYSARGGKGEPRKIWGGLVPYGKVWRMGSDEATLLVTQKPIEIGGTTIPAGAYTLWLFPNEDGSAKVAVNKQIGQWGIPGRGQELKDVYDEANDVVRVDAQKKALSEPVNQFTMSVERNPGGGGLIKLAWENTEYSVPFTVKKS